MDRAGFRDYVFPLDHPQVARLQGKDAHAHAQTARGTPRAQELLIEPWSRLITEPFTGITTDGTPIQGLFDRAPDDAPVTEMVSAARRLLGLLDDTGRETVLLPLDARQWRMWNNTEIYFFVYGLRMDEISPDLRDAICAVLRVSLSDRGYGKTRHAMWLNGYLGELTGAPAILGEWSYNFTLFGEPSDREPWGWQLAGHHLALNCVIVDGQMVISPTFLGAEPNWAPEGPYEDAVLFADEERMGAELMASLSPRLQREAVVYDLLKDPAMPSGRWHQADQRHLGGAFRDNRVVPYEGARVSAFSPGQRDRLMALMAEFLVLPASPRAHRLAEIGRHLDDTYFCWIGATDGEHPFYYRIQSPVIMIEFDEHAGVFLSNEEPERFHIHTIVRTPNGNDYGMDLLRMHYAQAHPGHRPGGPDRAARVMGTAGRNASSRSRAGGSPRRGSRPRARSEHAVRRSQHVHWARHVVQPFEDRHQVIPASGAHARGIGRGEGDPVRLAGLLGIAAGGGDHIGVEVGTVHRDQRVRPRDRDAGPARAACQASHPGRWLAAQPPVRLLDRGQPLGSQQASSTSHEAGTCPGAPGRRVAP